MLKVLHLKISRYFLSRFSYGILTGGITQSAHAATVSASSTASNIIPNMYIDRMALISLVHPDNSLKQERKWPEWVWTTRWIHPKVDKYYVATVELQQQLNK